MKTKKNKRKRKIYKNKKYEWLFIKIKKIAMINIGI
jgi:hypothetical protein